jgi:hypothetical protein
VSSAHQKQMSADEFQQRWQRDPACHQYSRTRYLHAVGGQDAWRGPPFSVDLSVRFCRRLLPFRDVRVDGAPGGLRHNQTELPCHKATSGLGGDRGHPPRADQAISCLTRPS